VSFEQNKKVALAFLNAIERQDVDAIVGLMVDDAVYWIPGQANFPVAGTRNKQQTREFFAGAKQILKPGFKFAVKSMTAEDDRVSVEAMGDGTSVTGKKYQTAYHFMFRMRGDKIAYVAEYIDTQHVADVFSEFFQGGT
jgi:ketosteroid isomerase-like protein